MLKSTRKHPRLIELITRLIDLNLDVSLLDPEDAKPMPSPPPAPQGSQMKVIPEGKEIPSPFMWNQAYPPMPMQNHLAAIPNEDLDRALCMFLLIES